MAVEALLEALERDARSEAQRIRTEAQSLAEATIARAAADVNRRRELATERMARERRVDMARTAAETTRALKARVLTARARLLDQVFLEARGRLALLEPARWQDQVPALVRETLRYLDSANAVVRCQPEVLPQVELALAQVPGVRLEAARDALPGLVGQSVSGDVVVDNTLTARLDRLRDDLAIRLLPRLEGSDALG